MSAFADALILTGPTAGGKTALALELAPALGAEILAMDSMTVYRGLDVGTAKPTAAERAAVPHHLLDLLDPAESANVAWWLDRAAAACADIRSRGKRPLFVGGTPFYLKALLHGLFPSPPADPVLRAKLEAEPAAELHTRLSEVDPPAAARLHPNDVRRVVRALEVFELTGRPISSFQQTWDAPPPAISCVVLDLPREELYARIDRRVLAMLDAGWVEEADRLRSRPLSKEAGQAVGYRELFAHLAGTGPGWEATVALIQQRTRQFAKRQLTWFRSLPCVSVPGGDAEAVRRAFGGFQDSFTPKS